MPRTTTAAAAEQQCEAGTSEKTTTSSSLDIKAAKKLEAKRLKLEITRGRKDLDGILNIKVPNSGADPAWELAPHDDEETRRIVMDYMGLVNGFKTLKASDAILPTGKDFVDLCNKSSV